MSNVSSKSEVCAVKGLNILIVVRQLNNTNNDGA